MSVCGACDARRAANDLDHDRRCLLWTPTPGAYVNKGGWMSERTANAFSVSISALFAALVLLVITIAVLK